MSIKCMNAVWSKSSASGTDLLLLLALADHASDDGVCWPATETLAQKTRTSKRQVQRLLQRLEESGELIVARMAGRGNTNMYYLTLSTEETAQYRAETEMHITLTNRLGFSEDDAGQAILEQKGIVQTALFETEKAKTGKLKGDVGVTFSRTRDAVPRSVAARQDALKGDVDVTFSGIQIPLKDDTDVTFYPTEKVTSRAEKVTSRAEKVTSRALKGDIAMSPEPSEPSFKPSEGEPSKKKTPDGGTFVPPSANQFLKHISTHHPAVEIYKATGITKPDAATRDTIGESVGTDPPDLALWELTVRWWMTSGGGNGSGKKNPRNVQAMLDVWRDARTYLDTDPELAFAAWREVRSRTGWSRPYTPPEAYADGATDHTAQPPPEAPGPPEAALWEKTKAAAELQMARATYQAHIKPTHCRGPNGSADTWIIAAPAHSVDWLDTRLRVLLERTASQVAGRDIHLQFVAQPEPQPG